VIAVGECLHGTVQAPLVADLADHRLIGRYMATSAFSWGVGFTVGPAIGGIVLDHSPNALWPAAAAVCLAAGAAALALERAIPSYARRTPTRREPVLATASPPA
jgi:MFS family permease